MARLLVRDVYLEEIPSDQEPLMTAWLKSQRRHSREDPEKGIYRWDGVLAGYPVAAEGEGPFAQELAESLHRLLDLAGALPGEGELPALRLTLVEGASPGRVEGWYIGMPFARSWLTVFRALRHAQAPLQRRELHWDLKGTFRLFRRQTPVRFRIEVSEEGSLLSWLSSLYGLLLSALGRSYPQKDLDTFVAKGLGAAMATAPTRAREGLGGGVSAAFPSVHVFQRRPGEREIPPLMRTPNKRTGWQPPA